MSIFSIPPLSIPGLSDPVPSIPPPSTPPLDLDPTDPTSFSVPPISFSLPDLPPTTTVRPPPTSSPHNSPTARPTTPTVSTSPTASNTLSPEPSTPTPSPPSNVQSGNSTSTSTVLASPTGQLSPSNGSSMTFLDNKAAKAGVFSVVAIVALSLILGLGALLYRRRKRRQFDMEHNEAMVGYAPRVPIDGDDEGYPSSQSHSHTYYYSKTSGSRSGSDEMVPSTSYPMMRERRPSDVPPVPVYLPNHLAYNNTNRSQEEYNPYQESQDPFVDRNADQGHFNQNKPLPQASAYTTEAPHLAHEYEYEEAKGQREDADVSEESMYLEPPSPWPRMGQLPPAFGSPGPEVSLELPQRKALRVTNGLDDSHA